MSLSSVRDHIQVFAVPQRKAECPEEPTLFIVALLDDSYFWGESVFNSNKSSVEAGRGNKPASNLLSSFSQTLLLILSNIYIDPFILSVPSPLVCASYPSVPKKL